jgi:transcriptional regulator with XRE-family HTH domain
MQVHRLVSGARGSSGLAVRALASSADVAGPTITRIQSGSVDPSVDTLNRILDAAGFELRISAVRKATAARPALANLTDAWTKRKGRLQLDWTRGRALPDELALHPELVPEAIHPAPWPSGEPSSTPCWRPSPRSSPTTRAFLARPGRSTRHLSTSRTRHRSPAEFPAGTPSAARGPRPDDRHREPVALRGR